MDTLRSKRGSQVKKKEAPKEHLNLFADYEKRKVEMDKYVDQDKQQDQEKWEKQFTMYLGETRDGKRNEKPWYAQQQHPTEPKSEKLKRNDEKRKKQQDPMALLALLDKSSPQPVATISRPTTIEGLRKERLERERLERERAAQLMGIKSTHDTEQHFYHSQFNPDAVRQSKRRS